MSASPPYSGLERVLHAAAFSSTSGQVALASLEDRLFASRLEGIAVRRPVFVTALPRAGTTVLLEILAAQAPFATHTYRSMPFVLSPLLWEQVSRPFHLRMETRERAHGDGIKINYDSPEAFEEILWKALRPDKYHQDRIEPWRHGDADEEMATFLRNHMRKVVALHDAHTPRRYLSKNNANIARLELLPRMFPDCRIVIPLRNPRDHAESLRRQHIRFTELHDEDPFGRRYMEWLGHFEFGAALRPIDFDGWLDASPYRDPTRREFWLAYWRAAHLAIERTAGPNVRFIDYDAFSREPEAYLSAIATAVGLGDVAGLREAANRLRPSTKYEDEQAGPKPEVLRECQEIHARLTEKSLQAAETDSM